MAVHLLLAVLALPTFAQTTSKAAYTYQMRQYQRAKALAKEELKTQEALPAIILAQISWQTASEIPIYEAKKWQVYADSAQYYWQKALELFKKKELNQRQGFYQDLLTNVSPKPNDVRIFLTQKNDRIAQHKNQIDSLHFLYKKIILVNKKCHQEYLKIIDVSKNGKNHFVFNDINNIRNNLKNLTTNFKNLYEDIKKYEHLTKDLEDIVMISKVKKEKITDQNWNLARNFSIRQPVIRFLDYGVFVEDLKARLLPQASKIRAEAAGIFEAIRELEPYARNGQLDPKMMQKAWEIASELQQIDPQSSISSAFHFQYSYLMLLEQVYHLNNQQLPLTSGQLKTASDWHAKCTMFLQQWKAIGVNNDYEDWFWSQFDKQLFSNDWFLQREKDLSNIQQKWKFSKTKNLLIDHEMMTYRNRNILLKYEIDNRYELLKSGYFLTIQEVLTDSSRFLIGSCLGVNLKNEDIFVALSSDNKIQWLRVFGLKSDSIKYQDEIHLIHQTKTKQLILCYKTQVFGINSYRIAMLTEWGELLFDRELPSSGYPVAIKDLPEERSFMLLAKGETALQKPLELQTVRLLHLSYDGIVHFQSLFKIQGYLTDMEATDQGYTVLVNALFLQSRAGIQLRNASLSGTQPTPMLIHFTKKGIQYQQQVIRVDEPVFAESLSLTMTGVVLKGYQGKMQLDESGRRSGGRAWQVIVGR